MGVMDYFDMQNIQADTKMRDKIGKFDEGNPGKDEETL